MKKQSHLKNQNVVKLDNAETNLRLSKNSRGLAGEFAVMSQLLLRGYDAGLTLGNTKSVDILVSDHERKPAKTFRLEVKTTLHESRREPYENRLFGLTICEWRMTEKHEQLANDTLFYCFVLITADSGQFTYRYFVVPNDVVALYVKAQHQYWLKASSNHKENSMRKFRIGTRRFKYVIDTPCIEDYEDNWEFKARAS